MYNIIMNEINNFESESKICAEIYRNKCGLYSFVCFYCGHICDCFEQINKHINERHFTDESVAHHNEDASTYEVISDDDTESEDSCILVETSEVVVEVNSSAGEEDACASSLADSIVLLKKDQENLGKIGISNNKEKEQNTNELLLVPMMTDPNQTTQTSEVKTFECDYCEKKFSAKRYLRNHMQIHTGKQNKFKCDICLKTLGSRRSLRYHFRIHTGEKPYTCMVCEKSFTFRGSLEHHKLLHSKQKKKKKPNQYKYINCDFCSKKMCSKEALKQHIRLHTGEKPYKCKLCKKCFTFRGSLVNHMAMHYRWT